jgi:aminoglycoside phosphotransferase (APT) family kinase protein
VTLEINTSLVQRLIHDQFPHWAHLPINPVARGGWDNRTFHLGSDMLVRLPSAAGYAAQVAKEQRWLPYLAPRLPLPIPAPLAQGEPGQGYPYPWSVYTWLEGEPAATARIADLEQFAVDLAGFLTVLQGVNATDGPLPGEHSALRGAPPSVWDADVQRALTLLEGRIDTRATRTVWDAALEAKFTGAPVWFHGDVAVGNLLVNDGRLSALIDFGCAGVGDPACDLVIAWTLFTHQSRAAFKAGLNLDAGTWARGRGWALWKALITLSGLTTTNAAEAQYAQTIIERVLEDHQRGEP